MSFFVFLLNFPHIIIRVLHPPQLVGWPPVRTFRRNLGVQNQSKSMMNSEPKVEEIKFEEKESMDNELQKRPTMFVKVNMEGCTVGRKIDLKLHNGYDSLSHALQKLFRNFLYGNFDALYYNHFLLVLLICFFLLDCYESRVSHIVML